MQIAYVPHGINDKIYFPISEIHSEFKNFTEFKNKFKQDTNSEFIVFWNNRNIRRKQPGDVILAYRIFCDKLTSEQASKCMLFMHTDPIDENGTDLIAVIEAICPKYKVQFSSGHVSSQQLNYYYNMSDVTLNIASNEGFGLSSAESIMAGCVVVNNVTGGLQDQLRFDNNGKWLEFNNKFTSNHNGKFKDCGEWAYPVFPSNRSLQGSVMTPYIFDERCNPEDVANGLKYWYDMDSTERTRRGLSGSEWMKSRESGMSAFEMSRRMEVSIENCINSFKPKPRYELVKCLDKHEITEDVLGVDWKGDIINE